MQTSDSKRATQSNHRKVQASTTLNRKYTKRPAKSTDVMVRRNQKVVKREQQKVERSPKIARFNSPKIEAQTMAATQLKVQPEETIRAVAPHPMQATANARMQAMQSPTPMAPKVTAKQLKDQAIEKALASAEKMPAERAADTSNAKKTKKKAKNNGLHFGFGRVMLATACAAAAVFAIVYFVNLNMPDISLRVAAMQTGMDPTYPNYVPRDYSVSSITSEDGKITIDFRNGSTGDSFTLTEEKSSWDTNALLSNFVKGEYGENYTIVREQGLTIYVSGSDAAWVNGGIVYRIDTTAGSLTNKQIRSIATSL